MITPARLSYGVLGVTIILAGLLHLGTPLLAVLFSYLALRQSYFLTKRKWLALILFGVVVTWDRRCGRVLYPGRHSRVARCG